MYGIVKCLPVSRRKSISDSSPEPVEVVDHDRARGPGVKSRNRSSWPRIAATLASSVVAVEQVPLGRTARRVADHARPAADDRDRPAAEALEAEQPEDRHEVADVERRARRVEPDVAADRPAGRQARRQARRRGVEDAPPLELGEQSGQPDRRTAARPSQARASRRLDQPGGGEPFVHAPYAIVRPQMQTSLARRQRHRRALQRRPQGHARIDASGEIARSSSSSCFVLIAGLVAGAGASSPSAPTTTTRPACPTPRRRSPNLDFEQQTIIYDRTGKIELARLGELKREVVTFDQLPGEIIDATTAIEDKDFWDNAGFDPIGIVSAGLDTSAGRPRGASTITQQLVRARLLPAEAFEGIDLRAQGRARSSSRSG